MSGRQTYSLRRRLVGLLIAVVALLWSLSAAVAFRTAHGEADELFDAQMVQVAETLLAIVAAGGPGHVAHEMAEHQHDYQLPVAFQAWQRDETGSGWHLLVRSAEMTDVPATREVGFDEHEQQGDLWRFYTVDHDHGRYRVIVGQQHATRYRLAGEIALHLLFPILIGLPLIAIGIWVVVGRALRPVDAVARAVGGLDARHLAPVRIDGPLPAEIAPLVGSLDALVVRLAEALDNERRFTADAAHELRTPLAALRIQAQVACRSIESGARQHALEQVLSGVERMTHLVEQLLTLARLDPDATLPDGECVDLAELARSVCSTLAPQALRREQSLSLDDRGAMPVTGNHWWLEVLVRNLVDNALRYTPLGGEVHVLVDAVGRRLVVSDNGPGIDPVLRDKMLTRFARGAEADAGGCGLGLSIVARIATILGARLDFGQGLPRPGGGEGLAVLLTFPPAIASSGE
ncbi:ATP-binding protein [Zoogloea sp.]|uniref:ATP-binding protein n=1 Tax=Zoogloea sp. TaxID=49181 RepID=UPI0035B06129